MLDLTQVLVSGCTEKAALSIWGKVGAAASNNNNSGLDVVADSVFFIVGITTESDIGDRDGLTESLIRMGRRCQPSITLKTADSQVAAKQSSLRSWNSHSSLCWRCAFLLSK